MKFGRIPFASIALIVVCVLRLALKPFTAASAYYSPFFDGMLAGVVLAYLLYYVCVFITAWFNNRKEQAANQ